jgi:hypothetical protein
MRKASKLSSSNMVHTLLIPTLLVCLFMLSVPISLGHCHDISPTQSSNWGSSHIRIIIEPSWWGTHSPCSTLQFFICRCQMILRGGISGLEDMWVLAWSTSVLIISSHSSKLSKRFVIALQKSFDVL